MRPRRNPATLAALVLVAGAAIGAVSRASCGPVRQWPPAVELSFGSDALRDEIGLRVYLPPDYHASMRRYPVIYFLHGLPATPVAYRNTEFLPHAMADLGREAIVVAVQGARDSEPDSEYLDSGPGRNWETAVAIEVPRFVDRRFRTIRDRRGRAIIGVSAGGYGAMLVGLHHLSRFAAIESWSGYFHPTDPTGIVGLDLGSAAKNANASAHSLIAGLRETFVRNTTYLAFYVGTDDRRFRPENEQLDRELMAARVPHLFRVFPGAHVQSLWTRHAAAWLGLALDHLARVA